MREIEYLKVDESAIINSMIAGLLAGIEVRSGLLDTDEQGNVISIKLDDTLVPVETRVDNILETLLRETTEDTVKGQKED